MKQCWDDDDIVVSRDLRSNPDWIDRWGGMDPAKLIDRTFLCHYNKPEWTYTCRNPAKLIDRNFFAVTKIPNGLMRVCIRA